MRPSQYGVVQAQPREVAGCAFAGDSGGRAHAVVPVELPWSANGLAGVCTPFCMDAVFVLPLGMLSTVRLVPLTVAVTKVLPV